VVSLLSFLRKRGLRQSGALPDLSLPWVAGAIAIAIVLVSLRFFQLGEKPFWLDEAFTAFHLSGYDDAQVNIFVQGQIRSAAELLQFQRNGQQGWADTVQHILETAPELPPLYFLLLKAWTGIFGPSVAAMRSLSAVFGTLLLPAIYWLGWVAFHDRRVGLLAMVLVGLSPFHLMLAQEARPYTLWLLLVTIATSNLLQAYRYGRRRHWLLYGLAMVLAFYTHLMTLIVILVQGLAVLTVVPSRRRIMVQGFSASGLLVGLGILPWIWAGFLRPQALDQSHYALPSRSLPDLIKGLIRGVSLFFVDLGLDETSSKPLLGLLFVMVLIVFGLIALAVVYGLQQRWSGRLLLTVVMLPPSLIFVSDLLLRGNRTLSVRYFCFSYTMLEILVALVLVQGFNQRLRSLRPALLSALVLMAMLSNFTYFSSPSWWHKTLTQNDRCIAKVTQPLDRPLLITDQFFVRTMALSHGVKPQLRFQILPPDRPNTAIAKQAPPGQRFLYLPSEALKRAVTQRYRLEPTCGTALLKLSDRL
jgi:uncharacterized membrane protein